MAVYSLFRLQLLLWGLVVPGEHTDLLRILSHALVECGTSEFAITDSRQRNALGAFPGFALINPQPSVT